MKKYGVVIVIVIVFVGGVAAIIAYNRVRYAGIDKIVFSAMESVSAPYPKDLEAIVPRYPNSQGMNVSRIQENTHINANTEDSREDVKAFYLEELNARGWRPKELEEEDQGEDIYLFTQDELELMLFFSGAVFPDATYTTYFIVVTDKSKAFKPKSENSPEAVAIIESMIDTYRKCSSYRGEGSETTHFLNLDGEEDFTNVDIFKTAFIRPDLLRYEIVDTDDLWGEKKIIFSDSTGVYRWIGSLIPVESFSMAFASADPMLIPELLTDSEDTWLLHLHELSAPVEEDIDGNTCIRIDGKDDRGDELSLWIDKQTNLLYKMEQNSIFDDFKTKSVSIFINELNADIRDKELALRPFGDIPIPVGQIVVDINRFWHYSGTIIKLLYMSASLLFIAGVLYLIRAIRRWRTNRPVKLGQSSE